MRKISVCYRCHRPIPLGQEMVEKIDGVFCTTHLECHEHRGRDGTRSLDAMIRDAFRDSPSADLKRKAKERQVRK